MLRFFGYDEGTPSQSREEQIERLRDAIRDADAVVIGAGAGLSTSAGFTYGGERFLKYFGDFAERYSIRDIYSGGFYPYRTIEEQWGWWCRHIYVNRFIKAPKRTYETLLSLVKDKDYFVLTTNVDHQFQKAGFEKTRLFYTQGDYGLWQCVTPCHDRTYDNKDKVVKMVLSQGFSIGTDGELLPPTNEDGSTDFLQLSMTVPSDLVPYCPVCGEPMSMNLRADDTFVQDDGWYEANKRYDNFLDLHAGRKIVFLELGVGMNTPVIIKMPFRRMTEQNKNALYACINYGEANAPKSILDRAVCIDDDIDAVLRELR